MDPAAVLSIIEQIEHDMCNPPEPPSDGLLATLRGIRRQKTANTKNVGRDVGDNPLRMVDVISEQMALPLIIDRYIMHHFDWSNQLPNGCPYDVFALTMYNELLLHGSPCMEWVLSHRLLDINPSLFWWWNSHITDPQMIQHLCKVVVCHTIRQQLRLHMTTVVQHWTTAQKLAADVLRLARTILLNSLNGVKMTHHMHILSLCFLAQAMMNPPIQSVRQTMFHPKSLLSMNNESVQWMPQPTNQSNQLQNNLLTIHHNCTVTICHSFNECS